MSMPDVLGLERLTGGEVLTIVLAAIAVFSTAALVSVYLTWRRLRHIPGPFLNSITPLVLTYHCIKQDITVYTHTLTEKYGPLVRIAPNMIMFSDPDTFRHICSAKAGYTKGLWFEFSRWDLDVYSLISMRDNERRKVRKAQLSPAVSVLDGRNERLMVCLTRSSSSARDWQPSSRGWTSRSAHS